jgi:hypothetical protein
MFTVNSYEEISSILRDAFRNRYKHTSNITGIVFARPETPLTQTEIMPHIDYWFHRCDNYTDFFCGGYAVSDMEKEVMQIVDKDMQFVRKIGDDNW